MSAVTIPPPIPPPFPPPFPHELLIGEMIRSYLEAYPGADLSTSSRICEHLERCAHILHAAGHTAEDVRGVVFHPSGINFFASMRVEFPEFVSLVDKAHRTGCCCIDCRNKVM